MSSYNEAAVSRKHQWRCIKRFEKGFAMSEQAVMHWQYMKKRPCSCFFLPAVYQRHNGRSPVILWHWFSKLGRYYRMFHYNKKCSSQWLICRSNICLDLPAFKEKKIRKHETRIPRVGLFVYYVSYQAECVNKHQLFLSWSLHDPG